MVGGAVERWVPCPDILFISSQQFVSGPASADKGRTSQAISELDFCQLVLEDRDYGGLMQGQFSLVSTIWRSSLLNTAMHWCNALCICSGLGHGTRCSCPGPLSVLIDSTQAEAACKLPQCRCLVLANS